jgi:hypothetical protein
LALSSAAVASPCVAASTKANTLTGFVVERVLPASTVYTDEWVGYNDLTLVAIGISYPFGVF